jgi:hypothetical protein
LIEPLQIHWDRRYPMGGPRNVIVAGIPLDERNLACAQFFWKGEGGELYWIALDNVQRERVIEGSRRPAPDL